MRTRLEESLVHKPRIRAIALDGGTTNTRARWIENGRVVATARRPVGVRDTVLSDLNAGAQERPLMSAAREAIAEVARSEPELIVAAGMLTSDLGLVAVPHVLAPAGIDELAAAVVVRTIPAVAPQPIHFVPGVRTPPGDGPDGWMSGDVMRGEECETLGALTELRMRGMLELNQQSVIFVWPGSHTKVVEIDGRGRIIRSHTSLGGELIDAVSRHTLLAASLPACLPESFDLAAVEAGAATAAREGIARAAFLVRIAMLQGTLSPEDRAAFWVGAVVGDDAAHLVRHPVFMPDRPVWVGGRKPLRALYTGFLGRLHRGPVLALDDDLADSASALGALEIASALERTNARTKRS
jgi:2-dehydro-3-deoxygalactonokinase